MHPKPSAEPAGPAFWVILAAAGVGERMGSACPKQYLMLAGRTLIEHSMELFLAQSCIKGIMVVLAATDPYFARLPISRDHRIRSTVGGDQRYQSVHNGLRALQGRADAEDWVLVHDAARPCLHPDDLDHLLAQARDDFPGGLLAAPVSDTLKQADAELKVAQTIPRTGLWRALTPQMFRYDLLTKALAEALAAQVKVTDEAAAVERLGIKPVLIPGRSDNLKITYPSDLALAEAILAERKQHVQMAS